ncbi:MAG: YtxH domain-containing protein [Bacteroidota bacterium]
MPDRNEFGTFAIGMLVGGLTASVVALLFAPQSGEETRTMIKDKSIELRDQAQKSTEEAIARVEALANEALARVEEVARQLQKQKQGTDVSMPSMAAETPEGKPTAV